MSKTWERLLQVDLATQDQRRQLEQVARQRNWGLSLLLVAWLHLLAFSFCYYLTIVRGYHEAPGYLLVWVGELCGAWAIFRSCGGVRLPDPPAQPLERLIRRVWIAYFVLAFNLGSMNNLAGHAMFELFPAIAPLASFAFLMMTITVSWRFIGAVLVMFACGLLMAAHLLHAYLFFALAWWLVLNAIGLTLWLRSRSSPLPSVSGAEVEKRRLNPPFSRAVRPGALPPAPGRRNS